MSVWQAQQARLDAVVDRFWAEPVEFHPMIGGDVSQEPAPDSSREILTGIVAVYMRPGASITGEGGTQGAMLTTEIVQADIWASIQGNLIGGDEPIFGKDDRVYWPERNEWFSITYIAPSATNRPNVHLTRLNPNSVSIALFASDLDDSPPIFDDVYETSLSGSLDFSDPDDSQYIPPI
jgi:hypothetical protein